MENQINVSVARTRNEAIMVKCLILAIIVQGWIIDIKQVISLIRYILIENK